MFNRYKVTREAWDEISDYLEVVRNDLDRLIITHGVVMSDDSTSKLVRFENALMNLRASLYADMRCSSCNF